MMKPKTKTTTSTRYMISVMTTLSINNDDSIINLVVVCSILYVIYLFDSSKLGQIRPIFFLSLCVCLRETM
ncbi:hypothetical protein HanIR_Chr14g0725421 [Helianthus annuus]|nr:hypothetical protein HanIR_Chr14g0725421 [Helianthus annuus]